MKLNEITKYSKNLKLLYVEDDKELLEETLDVFNNFFGKIVIGNDGEEGLKLYKNDNFDLVITDIKMPKMDGITFAKEIKNYNPAQEIIVISAYNEAEKLIELIKIGIADFILKPMEFEQLLVILHKVCKNIFYAKSQYNFLLQQSKMAQIGEMVDIVAHQWLQFVNLLGMKTELLGIKNKTDLVSSEEIDKYVKETLEEIDELSKVLSEFRAFFKQKEKEKIYLKEIIKSCILLFHDYLVKHCVEVIEEIDDTIVEIYPNEFKQVILNIITNMVENFNEKQILNREIKFYNQNEMLYIEDNGGGIDKNIIEEIFNKDFTTKKDGSGKGLYLAKMVMHKINGDICVENRNNGVRFIIKVKNGN